MRILHLQSAIRPPFSFRNAANSSPHSDRQRGHRCCRAWVRKAESGEPRGKTWGNLATPRARLIFSSSSLPLPTFLLPASNPASLLLPGHLQTLLSLNLRQASPPLYIRSPPRSSLAHSTPRIAILAETRLGTRRLQSLYIRLFISRVTGLDLSHSRIRHRLIKI